MVDGKGFFLWIKTEFRISGPAASVNGETTFWPLAEASFRGNGQDGCGEDMTSFLCRGVPRYRRQWMVISIPVNQRTSSRIRRSSLSAELHEVFSPNRHYILGIYKGKFFPSQKAETDGVLAILQESWAFPSLQNSDFIL